ncbi:hypothetical protein SUGI_0303820 [Cryptomeria japonica]|nr:hypothetical protein SUGI_0303820 [Cryptomeria japonica]
MEVEACSNEPGFAGAWFEGVIVSQEGGMYRVQYDKFETDEGYPLIEELHYCQLRPRPPEMNIINWAAGDQIEVLDKDCWWEGVISKVLLRKQYRVYFPCYGNCMRCHYSNIRPKQEWKNGKWSLSLPVRKRNTSKQGNAFAESTYEVDECFHREECVKIKQFRCSKLAQHIDRGTLHAKGIFVDASLMNTDYKDYFVSTTESHTAFALACQDERDKVVNKRKSTYYHTTELPTHRENQNKNGIHLADDHNVSLHKLELFAYHSVLQAFHAQGSLSWEREILLTNLRFELHISCQEHTYMLEQLACGF